MTYYVLKNKLGHYLSKDNNFEACKMPRTTRHLTDAALYLHPHFYLEGFKVYKLEITETLHRTGYGE